MPPIPSQIYPGICSQGELSLSAGFFSKCYQHISLNRFTNRGYFQQNLCITAQKLDVFEVILCILLFYLMIRSLWDHHIKQITGKANRSLAFLRRNLSKCPERTMCCPSKTTCGICISGVGSTFKERY